MGGIPALIAGLVTAPTRHMENQRAHILAETDAQINSADPTAQALAEKNLSDPKWLKQYNIDKETASARLGSLNQFRSAMSTLATLRMGIQMGRLTPQQALERSVGTPAFPQIQALMKSEDPQAVAGIKAQGDITKERISQAGQTGRTVLEGQTQRAVADTRARAQTESASIHARGQEASAAIAGSYRLKSVNAAGAWSVKRQQAANMKNSDKGMQSFLKASATHQASLSKFLAGDAQKLVTGIPTAMAASSGALTQDAAMSRIEMHDAQLGELAAVDPNIISGKVDPINGIMQTILANAGSIVFMDPNVGINSPVPLSKFLDASGNINNTLPPEVKQSLKTFIAGSVDPTTKQSVGGLVNHIYSTMFDSAGNPTGEFATNKQTWDSLNARGASDAGGADVAGSIAGSPADMPADTSTDNYDDGSK